ncbi:MAG: SDR family oxidoreductase, partial [Pseudobutyrivibrio sp.]|nr:SDR family oxidoreductase [Pseudobutyrivibrio sp.]
SLSPNVVEKVMRTNFFSFYEMTRQFAKKKISNDGAKVVVISSIASEKPDKGQAAYAASKAAIDASIISLSKELMPRRININSVRPAFVKTPLSHAMTSDHEKYHINMQPLGLIEPTDVAIMVAYLMSPAANMITGRALDIDGGGLFA